MKKLALALCLLCLSLSTPLGAEYRLAPTDEVPDFGKKAIIGAGVASCGRWLEDRKTGRYYNMENWALGYISGAAMWGNGLDPLRQTDADGVAYWLDNYCVAKPTSYFHDAVDAFIWDTATATSGSPGAGR